MKCLCGYEYDFDFIDGEKVIIKGDEDFLQSKTYVVVETFYQISTKAIFVCPKCGTLRVDL